MRKILKRFLMLTFVVAYLFVGYSNVFAIERVYILPSTAREKAPKNNLFQLKGSPNKYILLDTTDEGYFVMTEKCVAAKALSVDGEPVPFDPENSNSVAYWMNNEFLESGYFPQVILDNIIERVYSTEAPGSKVPFSKAYDSKCKVVLLSQTEWSKYNAKFGYADDVSYSFWALRSVRELTGSPLVAAVASPNSGLTVDGKWSSSLGIRPAFYLSKDFFDEAVLEVANTGDTVMSLVRKETDVATLNKMYSPTEVYTLTETDIAPVADAVSIQGRGIVGEKITGSYSFVSLDAKAESGSMVQWERSADKTVWSTILGATKTYYIPTEEDVGRYVRMKVSPMTDSMSGTSYVSMPLGTKIRAISTPVASNVRIVTQEPIRPGTILDVKYSFNDENRDICSGTEYVWESSNDMVSTQSIGSSRYLKLSNNEAGKYVRVGVKPMKKTNSAVGRKTITGDIVYSDWMEVKNVPVITSGVEISRDVDATLSLSKTDEGISIMNILSPTDGKAIEKVTAVYENTESKDYTVVCEWQGASSVNGVYTYITSGTDVLEYAPSQTMWVRAKVYTKTADDISEAAYSEPMFIGTDKDIDNRGELSYTMQLTAGKQYEVWISNENISSSYAYSFQIEGASIPAVSSDKYLVNKIQQTSKTYVIGTCAKGVYNNAYCFKAGDLIPETNGAITISDVITTSLDNSNVSQAKVFIVEK